MKQTVLWDLCILFGAILWSAIMVHQSIMWVFYRGITSGQVFILAMGWGIVAGLWIMGISYLTAQRLRIYDQ